MVEVVDVQELEIVQNQISYVGLFSQPAFSLWSEVATTLERLFSALSSHEVGLSDIRHDSSSPMLADTSFTVFISSVGTLKLKLDRIEVIYSNFTDSDLAKFPEILESATGWLRNAIPKFSFQAHLFAYHNHSKLLGGTSRQFLSGFPQIELADIGQSLGNGQVFHWLVPPSERRFQLLIDHSNVCTDGLFTQFSIQMKEDQIDYTEVASTGRTIYERAIGEVGLIISD